MLISHLHFCSRVFPLHHYSLLLLLSSLLSRQPLRVLLSPSAASLFFHVLICHPLSKQRARVLLKVRLQEAFITPPCKERAAGATNHAFFTQRKHSANSLFSQIASRFCGAYEPSGMPSRFHVSHLGHPLAGNRLQVRVDSLYQYLVCVCR